MRIFVFGLGSIGSNLLVQLANMLRDFSFIGIDHDIVEEKNIGIQAYFLEHIDLLKTQAMHSVLYRFSRSVKYEYQTMKISSEQDLQSFQFSNDDIIIDCFDNIESRKLIKGLFHENVLHIGFSHHYTAEIIWDSDYIANGNIESDIIDICGMHDATAFISLIVSLSSIMLYDFILNKVKSNYVVTQKLHIKKL